MTQKVAVVIPSFNSKRWIVKLIGEVLANLPQCSIYVVDDNSPDKTAQAVKTKFGKDCRVKLIVRTGKGGRGSAVLAGFQEALKDKTNQLFVEMDSDFAHDPKDLPKLVEANKNHDVVAASRYLPGGKVVNMPWKRYVFSRLAMFWSRLILGIPVSDQTAFRCYNRKTLLAVNFDRIKSRGFFVITEMAYQLYKKGFNFGEIPVTVTYTAPEVSNFNLKEVKEAFISVIKLRLRF